MNESLINCIDFRWRETVFNVKMTLLGDERQKIKVYLPNFKIKLNQQLCCEKQQVI